MLADQFDAVIGVDTHQDTHTAAVVATATGAVLDELTVATDPDGYDALVELADRHHGLRVWSIEGTGSYGAGLTAHLQALGETVIEIERPNRPARRNGKSDAIDAVRGAREALALEHHAQPRSRAREPRSPPRWPLAAPPSMRPPRRNVSCGLWCWSLPSSCARGSGVSPRS